MRTEGQDTSRSGSDVSPRYSELGSKTSNEVPPARHIAAPLTQQIVELTAHGFLAALAQWSAKGWLAMFWGTTVI